MNRESTIKRLRRECPHGHPAFVELSLDEIELHSRKNHDYAKGGDPLGNFYRVARILSQYPNLDLGNPVVVCLTYLMKQIDAVLWMVAGNYEGGVEGLASRLQDISVYAKLAQIINEDVKEKDAKDLQ